MGAAPTALCIVLLLVALGLAAAAPFATWTWVGGSQQLNELPNYGQIRSQPAAPGGRDTMVTLVTPSGLKLETCGFGPDLVGEIGWLSDTWVLSLDMKWKWIAGSPLRNATGNYTGSPESPGSRSGTTLFPTNLPDVYALYGGFGFGAIAEIGGQGKLSDLWLFNTTSLEWFYLAGPRMVNVTGVYNTQGVTSPSSWPGSRVGPAIFQNPANVSESLMFGGWGFATQVGYPGPLNDYWQLQLVVSCACQSCVSAQVGWTWIGGPNVVNQPTSSSLPAGRYGSMHWTIPATGDGYMFGGWGRYADGDVGDLDDLWHWNASASAWSQVPTASVWPPARYTGMTWLWPGMEDVLALFGGSNWNDMWLFYVSERRWERIGGSTQPQQYGNYGALGKSSAVNWPGSRYGSAYWPESETSILFFGGFGLTVPSQGNVSNDLSDLWLLEMTS